MLLSHGFSVFRYQDMEEELKAMKAARAGEKLAERDADSWHGWNF